jgi:putative two-component system response regulator
MTVRSQKPLVLIVEDNSTNIDLLVNSLKNDYHLGIAKNGPKAIDYAQKHVPDLILLDIMMPEMNGYEVCKRLKGIPETENIPVIFITALTDTGHKTKGFEVGGVDYITKPFHLSEVNARVRTHLAIKEMGERLKNQNIILEEKVEEKTSELRTMLTAIIETMAIMVEVRDPYTAGHQRRVAQLACAIAKKMGLSENQINTLRIAGSLHDVGKIRIPTSIINRPGKLLDVEFELIQIHPQVGYDILRNIPSPLPFAQIVLQHHERLDGSGYPHGLLGKDILLESKILAVADVAEASSSYRPYRPALGIEITLKEISDKKGIVYDTDAVEVCWELFSKENFKFD